MPKIIYDNWGPHIESNFEICLKFVLQLAYKTVKMASSAVQRVFPKGIDGKKIIKE